MLKFLSSFYVDDNSYLYFYIGNLDAQNGTLIALKQKELEKLNNILNDINDIEIFFTPANTINPQTKVTKESLNLSKYIWVDVDEPKGTTVYPLKPTYIVSSGKGLHCYWQISTPLPQEQIELYNQKLKDFIRGADKGAWNFNRWLRVPNTTNLKYIGKPKVTIKEDTNLVYTLDEISILDKLDTKTLYKIASGDSRGYNSDSERDFKVIFDLVGAGLQETSVQKIFNTQPVGKKYKAHENPNHYLETTLQAAQKAVQSREENTAKDRAMRQLGLYEYGNCYYYSSNSKESKVTNFIFEVQHILQNEDGEDVLSLIAKTETGKEIEMILPRKAFNNKNMFSKYNNSVHLSITTNDSVFERILPYLMSRIDDEKVIPATPVLGLHENKGQHYLLTEENVLSKNGVIDRFKAPITYSYNERITPTIRPFVVGDNTFNLEHFLSINSRNLMLILLGWYASALIKPYMFKLGYRFPVLNVAGTHGSGKTTMIKLLSELFGQRAITYNADTTKFVLLSLMGSTNCYPIAISEFRQNTGSHLTRMLLLSYDTGQDNRGTADQRINNYPLTAPFSLDGEEFVQDPASRERIVVVSFPKKNTSTDSDYYKNFSTYSNDEFFFYEFSKWTLSNIDKFESMLLDAYNEFDINFNNIQTRIRHNHCMIHLGVKMVHDFLNLTQPSTNYLEESLKHLVNLETGSSKLLIDQWTEDIVSLIVNKNSNFEYSITEGKLHLNPISAHSQWMHMRSSRRLETFSFEAIRNQVNDVPYLDVIIKNRNVNFEIDINLALEYGIQIEGSIKNEIRL